ncbi:hypothetical protein SIID45300_02809 [Candidatus Magnetaquicoccaceae bacterium FCR-1]|uniref:ATPase AAA-type core domain-containing protein n=1 Tax=Candidatus Magnetaquiglobus chichijimensis TaxID=3141448 RepID=A0ABQ0CCN4_9PROT
MSAISSLKIHGFKSIRNLDLELRNLNVLIGSNGAGKSNFISLFQMNSELIEGRLQLWVQKQGGADRIFSFGIKNTNNITIGSRFGSNAYLFSLLPTVYGGLVFQAEKVFIFKDEEQILSDFEAGHKESNLKDLRLKGDDPIQIEIASHCYNAMSRWKIYHFHDTSEFAGMRRLSALHDQATLRGDGSNLAAYLFHLRESHPDVYAMIRKTVTLAAPFFDDFVLNPRQLPTGEEQIQLLWRQKGSDYPLWPSQLSDGTLRFICLVTALSQPEAPSTILIDEPELGLHPYAITLLGALMRMASQRMQVIVSTQSVPLINEFSIDDLLIVEREEGNTVFRRHTQESFAAWLESYSVGDLWMKNLLGGRPRA